LKKGKPAFRLGKAVISGIAREGYQSSEEDLKIKKLILS